MYIRMLFEDWCDPERKFQARSSMCQKEALRHAGQ
jgi:hypothetical protein